MYVYVYYAKHIPHELFYAGVYVHLQNTAETRILNEAESGFTYLHSTAVAAAITLTFSFIEMLEKCCIDFVINAFYKCILLCFFYFYPIRQYIYIQYIRDACDSSLSD